MLLSCLNLVTELFEIAKKQTLKVFLYILQKNCVFVFVGTLLLPIIFFYVYVQFVRNSAKIFAEKKSWLLKAVGVSRHLWMRMVYQEAFRR